MKRSDLFRRYAEVIDLCEGTKVNPLRCVKFSNTRFDEEPEFTAEPTKEYTFALAIVEDKPVFAGDVLFDAYVAVKIVECTDKINVLCRSTKDFYIGVHELQSYTWAKPNPFAKLQKAQAEGKRIVFYDGAKWIDTDTIDSENFKPESYKVSDYDKEHKFTVAPSHKFGCSPLNIKLTKCGITGKISAEVIE